MLTPEYLQNVPDNMVRLYAQAEADILADMARRISTYDYWIPAVEHQTKMLEEAGMVREDILARLKKLTGKTQKELRELMQEAGGAALKSDDEVYKRQGLTPSPIRASEDLRKILQAGYDKTQGTFQNLTMTTVRTATRQFEQALDRAYMQITMGGMDYNTSICRVIKQLSADGVGAIRYPSGRVDSIEVAVRRAIITGVNQTALQLQDKRAEEVGSDLVEVSAHSGARPEHAAWQGGIYSRSGKSKKYPDFRKTTGYGTGAGLGGWNCSHSFRPWFEGMSRTYSKELLEEYEAKSFTYNGKKLTEYEALQEQRKIERNIRRWKREQNALAAAGQDVSEAAAKVREGNATHRDFLEKTGLKPDATRLKVGSGGTMSGTAAAEKQTKEQLSKLEKEKIEWLKNLSYDIYGDTLDEMESGFWEEAEDGSMPEAVNFLNSLNSRIESTYKKLGYKNIVDVGKKVYTKIIKGEHTIIDDLKATNPKYKPSSRKYAENCQRCVPAYEMRRRGFDVSAKPSESGNDATANAWRDIFENAVWEKVGTNRKSTTVQNIIDNMEQYGDGARAEIYVVWQGGRSAHVFVAENEAGAVRFIDPQTNSTNVLHYFDSVMPTKTEMCRIDKLKTTDWIKGCCE